MAGMHHNNTMTTVRLISTRWWHFHEYYTPHTHHYMFHQSCWYFI